MKYKVGKSRLLECLKTADMSQQELADIMGVTRHKVNDWAHNRRRMSYEIAGNISKIIKCQMEDLFEWIEIKSHSKTRHSKTKA